MEPNGLNAYMIQVRELVDAKGFSSDESNVWQMLALIHTEVSEAADAFKKGHSYDEVGTELADAIIRILHLCSALGVDIETLFQAKMDKNWQRPYRYNLARGE
ncbi:MAG: MazG nucleotide pyrophosphohydrolase domain-containing protein [Chloroflexota bacterium]